MRDAGERRRGHGVGPPPRSRLASKGRGYGSHDFPCGAAEAYAGCGKGNRSLLQSHTRNGRITATWFVVAGSGTGALSGLRGEGGFAGNFGKASNATLSYWFE